VKPRGQSSASCLLQPPERGPDHVVESGHLFLEISAARGRDSIRPPAVVRFEGANPADLEKSGDGSVKGARAEFYACELLDIEHHAVTVFIAVGQAGED
jgi:hypothetical protein